MAGSGTFWNAVYTLNLSWYQAVLQICTTCFFWTYKVLCIIWACIFDISESIKCPCVSFFLLWFSTSMSHISLINWFVFLLLFQVLKKHFASNFFLAVVTWKSCVVRASSSAPPYKVCCECWARSSKKMYNLLGKLCCPSSRIAMNVNKWVRDRPLSGSSRVTKWLGR